MKLLNALIDGGRPGGVLLLGLALGAFAVTWWDYSETGGFFLLFPSIGVVCALLGAPLLVLGDTGERRPRLDATKPASPQLIEDLATQPRPYFVCLTCRDITGAPPCLGCGSSAEVLEVRDDGDMKMVLAALS